MKYENVSAKKSNDFGLHKSLNGEFGSTLSTGWINVDESMQRCDKDRAPAEISSKRPIKFEYVTLPQKEQVSERITRDPRFVRLPSQSDKELFSKRYRFLFDEQLPGERSKLQMAFTKEPK